MIKKYTTEEYNILTPYHLGLEVEKPKEEIFSESDYLARTLPVFLAKRDFNFKSMLCVIGDEIQVYHGSFERLMDHYVNGDIWTEYDFYNFITVGRPEPEWVSFEKEMPKNPFYVKTDHGVSKYYYESIKEWNPIECIVIPKDFRFWADKQTYDNTLAIWNMYQRKYKGWIQSNRITGLTAFFKDEIEVIFSRENIIVARSSDFKYEAKKIKTSLFETIINQ